MKYNTHTAQLSHPPAFLIKAILLLHSHYLCLMFFFLFFSGLFYNIYSVSHSALQYSEHSLAFHLFYEQLYTCSFTLLPKQQIIRHIKHKSLQLQVKSCRLNEPAVALTLAQLFGQIILEPPGYLEFTQIVLLSVEVRKKSPQRTIVNSKVTGSGYTCVVLLQNESHNFMCCNKRPSLVLRGLNLFHNSSASVHSQHYEDMLSQGWEQKNPTGLHGSLT